MKSVHDSIMATMLLKIKKRKDLTMNLNKSVTNTHTHKHKKKGNDKQMIMNTPSTTPFSIRTMFRVLQMNSVQLGPSPQTISKFLCFLVSSGI